MTTLALQELSAYPRFARAVEMIAISGTAGQNGRNVALLAAVVLLFTALTLMRRAFQPLREVVITVMAAVIGAMLIFAAFVLLLAAIFLHS